MHPASVPSARRNAERKMCRYFFCTLSAAFSTANCSESPKRRLQVQKPNNNRKRWRLAWHSSSDVRHQATAAGYG
jgi:hypothetical protein